MGSKGTAGRCVSCAWEDLGTRLGCTGIMHELVQEAFEFGHISYIQVGIYRQCCRDDLQHNFPYPILQTP